MALSEEEINARINTLAENMRKKGLAWSDSQARERAKDIVMQEVKMQATFEAMKDDPSQNPQQRKVQITKEEMKQAGGMLTGDELPKDVPLSELLKGRREIKK